MVRGNPLTGVQDLRRQGQLYSCPPSPRQYIPLVQRPWYRARDNSTLFRRPGEMAQKMAESVEKAQKATSSNSTAVP